MMPVIPHITSECLDKLGHTNDFKWPIIDKKYIKNNNINLVVQVNGKKRKVLSLDKNFEENELIMFIKQQNLLKNYLNDKKIIKTIYIKNKLLNLIVK
jgi:leucyl-tRNA synthetase